MATEQWLERIASEQGLPEKIRFALQVCAEELLTNVLKHSGRSDPRVDVTLTIGTGKIELLVVDDGAPFNIAAAPRRVVDRPLEQTEPGGLGIQLIHQFADDLEYERFGPANKLRAIFRLPKSN
jgi:anti-sigma regulatory factor (Ser/Thr protein kinase)